MATLTIKFASEDVEPIVVNGCYPEFSDGEPGPYELPRYEGKHYEIALAMVEASKGALHMDQSESLDAYVFFNQEDDLFTFWEGNGDNKNRGYLLDPGYLLPFMESITVTPEEGDE